MASLIADDFDPPSQARVSAATEGGEEDMTMTMGAQGLMGETLEFNASSIGGARGRRGVGVGKEGGLRGRAISSMSEGLESAEGALVDYEEQVKIQRQLGEEGNVERGRHMKDLANAFKRDLEAMPAVRQQLDALQNRAAAVVAGVVAPRLLQSHNMEEDDFLNASISATETGFFQRLQLPVSLLVQMVDIPFYEHPLIRNPCFALPALEAAVQEVWRERGALGPAPRVGMLGWLGHDHVTPRGLSSHKVNRLVCVEGVVNRCTAVQPKLCRAVYVSEPQGGGVAGEGPGVAPGATPGVGGGSAETSQERQVYVRAFYDITNLDKDIRDTQAPPERDPTGLRVNRQELGYSHFKNVQRFFLQEAPETSPTGQLPRSVEVLVEEDLCDRVKCGDRVRVWGVYRPRMGTTNGTSTGLVRPFLIANNIQILTVAARASLMRNLPSDIHNLQTFSRRPDLLSVLTRSFAPSICGHDLVKRGLLLQLAGGIERTSAAASSHRIRGDIHILLVGDPSAGKSQLLRFVLQLMPGSVSATGRGSSGVGLTAAIVTDAETGERRVEGGAMVMADRNIVCIDEFDKMLVGDRVAIHEVMEQQTITVAKAGIHTTLNARCSVLAAANPLYGCWSDDMDYKQQLTFEDSLMSRFDLIFVVRDSSTAAEDERLAAAVLRNVTEKAKPVGGAQSGEERRAGGGGLYQVQPQKDMAQTPSTTHQGAAGMLEGRRTGEDDEEEDEEGETKVFCQRSEMSYLDKAGREHEVLTTDFLKKYIQYVRRCRYEEDEEEEDEEEMNTYATRSSRKRGAGGKDTGRSSSERDDPHHNASSSSFSSRKGNRENGGGICGPQLSDEAAQSIIRFYSDIRERCFSHQGTGHNKPPEFSSSSGQQNGLFHGGALLRPVTARTLEAILRLSTAHAKLKMQRWVTPEDVRVAKGMILYTLFGEEPEEGDDSESSDSEEEDSEAEEEEDDAEDEDYVAPRRASSSRRQKRTDDVNADRRQENEEDEEDDSEETGRRSRRSTRAARRNKRQRGGESGRQKDGQTEESLAEDDDEGEISHQLGTLGLSPKETKKKRRTRGSGGGKSSSSSSGAVERLDEVHGKAKRKDCIQHWIVACLKASEDGSGVEVAALYQMMQDRVKEAGVENFTEDELREELKDLDSKDSAPILFHGGRVYEC